MSQKIKGASEAAQAVMTDLQGRTGFELFWEGIDLETQREIQASLATVISDAVKAAQDSAEAKPKADAEAKPKATPDPKANK